MHIRLLLKRLCVLALSCVLFIGGLAGSASAQATPNEANEALSKAFWGREAAGLSSDIFMSEASVLLADSEMGMTVEEEEAAEAEKDRLKAEKKTAKKEAKEAKKAAKKEAKRLEKLQEEEEEAAEEAAKVAEKAAKEEALAEAKQLEEAAALEGDTIEPVGESQ